MYNIGGKKLTLKEEFISIVKLLIEPYEFCEIILDCNVKFCKCTSEIRSTEYMNETCLDCKSKTDNCFIQFNADVGIEDLPNDRSWYINFCKKGRKGYLYNIHNRKDMFEFLRDFKNDIEDLDNSKLEYAKKCEELLKYANEFFKELINKYFSNLTPDILPIKFHRSIKINDNCPNGKQTAGEVGYSLKQNIINIYLVMDKTIDEVKQVIRHELIHYCLNMSNYVSDDNIAIFYALCKRHDAHIWAGMLPDEKVKFDKWDESDKIFEKIISEKKGIFNNKDIQDMQKLQEQSILGLGSNDNMFDDSFKKIAENLEKLKNAYKLVLEHAYLVTQKYKDIK